MRLFTIENWDTLASVTTEQGCFYGIAFGPESEEGLVRITASGGTTLLQSGRTLPLRAAQYQVQLVNALSDGFGFDEIKKLQLMLFEHPGELAVPVDRANGRYRVYVPGTDGALHDAITVPFVGRRQCMFALSTANVTRYQVVARIRQTNGDYIEATVVDVAGAFTAPFAFYIGGTNEGENWHTLKLRIAVAIGEECDVVVETIGEIGR